MAWILDERIGCVAVYEEPKRNCLEDGQPFIFYAGGVYDAKTGWSVAKRDVAIARMIWMAPDMHESLKDLRDLGALFPYSGDSNDTIMLKSKAKDVINKALEGTHG